MAYSPSFDSIVVRRVSAQQAPLAKAPSEQSHQAVAADNVGWAAMLVTGVIAIGVLVHFTLQQANTQLLQQADNASIAQTMAQDVSQSQSPEYAETLAELAMQLPTPDEGSAYAAATRATELDASRARAWAQLAYLETRRASGNVNEASLNALDRSMNACPLCSQELVAWRFNFVLTNWHAIPDPLRRRAFEQADILRWAGQNAEFLGKMRVKARENGIPFDAYRVAVKTPARTWDIDPSVLAKAEQTAEPS
ncbi:MAG TPA: hypothetical protein PLN33_14570 [Hyphomonadaceae bacterium]|jgi:hypothetical protein|nr:hypothetical protein [Hyphomonadaceae bacterium]HPN05626.1 hypothetical protein [Hyphomonadaceae bacterium]